MNDMRLLHALPATRPAKYAPNVLQALFSVEEQQGSGAKAHLAAC